MKQKLITFIVVMALALALTGCSPVRPDAEEAPAAQPQTAGEAQENAEGDGQNPVMNYIGVYSTEFSTEALVEAEGAEDARITVTYAGNPWFQNRTVMSGRFDPETLTVEFTNAVLTEYTYNSDGSVGEETVAYENGAGRAVFSPEDGILTITETYPEGERVTVYGWGPSPDMKTVGDPDHYASVTAMDKARVETEVGFRVRTDYLSENWYDMADMIRYPITINGAELADADAFLDYMSDKTVSESERQAMLDEDLLDMFVNAEGIMMGDGEIWLSDPNYLTDRAPELQIIAVNGIVTREEGEAPAAEAGEEAGAEEPARQDGERCLVAAAHYTIESAEGFGSAFRQMVNTICLIGG